MQCPVNETTKAGESLFTLFVNDTDVDAKGLGSGFHWQYCGGVGLLCRMSLALVQALCSPIILVLHCKQVLRNARILA